MAEPSPEEIGANRVAPNPGLKVVAPNRWSWRRWIVRPASRTITLHERDDGGAGTVVIRRRLPLPLWRHALRLHRPPGNRLGPFHRASDWTTRTRTRSATATCPVGGRSEPLQSPGA